MFWSCKAVTEETVDVSLRFGAGRRLKMAFGGSPGCYMMDSPVCGMTCWHELLLFRLAFADLSGCGGNGKWYTYVLLSDSHP